jgi:energy-coupling factor transporter ATP-binding protein EcfA2
VAADACISVRGLGFTHAHASRPALRDVTLDVARGEYLGVVGLNGAGKTTLALSLNGVVPQMLPGERTGTVTVEGRDPATTPVREMARNVGMVFDDAGLQLSQASVADEVALGLESLGVPWAEMDTRVGDALEAVGLAGLAARSPMTLSGGEQQRLAIACALVLRPGILVMDEPLGNLDPGGRAAVLDIVRQLNREDGVTVVLAEHDVEALAEHAHRVVVLDEGAVVLDGTPDRVFGEVEMLHRLGLRVPQVTELAASLEPRGVGLPVTLDGAVAWLSARA